MQLIAFFNKSNFGDLVEEYCSNEGFKRVFKRYDEEGQVIYFDHDDPNSVIYVSADGSYDIGSFNESTAKRAAVLLFKDSSDFMYTPDGPFFILRHTEDPLMLPILTQNNLLQSVIRQTETRDFNMARSIYFHLASFVGSSDRLSFERLMQNLPKQNKELRAATDLLLRCYSKDLEGDIMSEFRELALFEKDILRFRSFLHSDRSIPVTDERFVKELSALRNKLLEKS